MTTDDPRDQFDRPDEPDEGAHRATGPPIGAGVDHQASAALDRTPGRGTSASPDPAVAARAAEMAAARDVLRTVPPPDPRRRDGAIDAALAAFDDERALGSPAAPGAGGPDELAARRARAPRHRAARRLVAAAAALVVVAAVGVAVARSGDDETTTASDSMAADEGGESDGGGGDDEAADPSTAAPEASEDSGVAGGPESGDGSVATLGEHASAGSLLDAAAGVEAGAVAPQASADGDLRAANTLAARCPTGLPGPIADAGDEARLVATGTVDGETIEVWRGLAPDGALLVAVDEGCQVVSTRPVD